MDEFKLVLRSLLLAMLVMFISQYKLNNETIEAKAQYALIHSSSAETLRQIAAGGVKFIRETTESAMTFIKSKIAQNDGGSRSELSKYRSNQIIED